MPSESEGAYGAALTGLDPASLADALRDAVVAITRDPSRLARSVGELASTQSTVALAALQSVLSDGAGADVPAVTGDRRFADRAWKDNPFLRASLEGYLAWGEWTQRLLGGLDLPLSTARKAGFAASLLVDAVSPANVPWLNPAVVKEAIDTGGLSLVRGFRNFVDDALHNGGRPRQVDTSPFEVGRNLAATPGRVVYRNDLMELLAYQPQTDSVFSEPIVCSPPWINRYYIMDLAPDRSFIEYAVRAGFTVFAISYRNADASMADVTMDDYLCDGLLTALEEAGRITGSPRVNVVALCLGGTMAMIALAHLAARGEAARVGWATVTNTLVDFSEPGDLGVFTDEASIAKVEETMRRRGYLEASAMSGTFDWMRGNDLVWGYVVENWYRGKQPPAFDILTWNADSTRMPAAMHSQYLRSCYLHNSLVDPGAFVAAGTPIDLSKVETPLYVLGAEADHIAPWTSAYRTTQLVSGDVSFTLTSSGHIAGMVNPPGNPKAAHWRGGPLPPDPLAWRAGAEQVRGSWWESWVEWAAGRSGDRVTPPALPDGEPAPGRYVRN